MQTTLVPAQAGNVLEINETAKRATSSASSFFSTCSLNKSQSDCAELCFLRSVLYYYALLCECGSGPVRFCANQSQFKSLAQFDVLAALKVIHALRTQAAHSLAADAGDNQLLMTARLWFRQYACADVPTEASQWAACAKAMDEMGDSVLQSIVRFLQLLETDPEMDAMRSELRQAIEGGLRRADIESVAAKVLDEQGRNDLSPGKFTERYLSEWNKQLRIKSGRSDLLQELKILIERTLSEFPEPPPLTGTQIIESLGISQGPIVGELVRERDRLLKAGIRNSDQLLAKLRDYATAFQQGRKLNSPLTGGSAALML